ncbi:MAG: hypothetical protein WKG07_19345 [Hymenobacter sp.]
MVSGRQNDAQSAAFATKSSLPGAVSRFAERSQARRAVPPAPLQPAGRAAAPPAAEEAARLSCLW